MSCRERLVFSRFAVRVPCSSEYVFGLFFACICRYSCIVSPTRIQKRQNRYHAVGLCTNFEASGHATLTPESPCLSSTSRTSLDTVCPLSPLCQVMFTKYMMESTSRMPRKSFTTGISSHAFKPSKRASPRARGHIEMKVNYPIRSTYTHRRCKSSALRLCNWRDGMTPRRRFFNHLNTYSIETKT